MAQTTGGISSKDYKIESSPDGSAWTDRSGFGLKIDPSGGDRDTGSVKTFDGDKPIQGRGKRNLIMVACEMVYTEGASDFYEIVRAAYEAGSDFYLRWSPKGGQTGEFVHTTDVGVVKNFKYPAGDASNGNPVVVPFGLETTGITKSVAS